MKSKKKYFKIFNFLALLGTAIFLLGSLVHLLAEAFTTSFNHGLRSIAACILPAIITFYVSSYTTLGKQKGQNQNFNLFILYFLWTLMILLVVNARDFVNIPVAELLFSTTLTSIFWRATKKINDSHLFACCYGVLVGLLSFIFVSGRIG